MEKSNNKTISLDEIYPIIKEQLESGGTVQIPITGTSMIPLLVWGRDSVELVKCEKAQIGDIIFYRRDDGHFVLHRIVGKDENGYVLCGDNQWVKEFGIEDRHLIGVVNAITRKGKKFSVENKLYTLYSKIWVEILPLRKYFLFILRRIIKPQNKKQ